MRVVLAQLAPSVADVAANLATVREVARAHPGDLLVLPELFLSGYRVGDAVHHLALAPGDPTLGALAEVARTHRTTIVVGAPVRHARAGEVENAAVLAGSDGSVQLRTKRFLPTYGPFEEGATFTPADRSEVARVPGAVLGVSICYDAFFPEVARSLALGGAQLLVVLSAAPVTSRTLFDRVLPARAVENALPLVYVNRVGVEDGIVFGGGSMALDARGAVVGAPAATERGTSQVLTVELDLREAGRWRPFRPVLRDVAARDAPGRVGAPGPDPAP